MKINNTLSLSNYDFNIVNKNENKIEKVNDLVKTHKSEFYLDITNSSNLESNFGHFQNNELNEKINTLKNIKTFLEKEFLPKYDTPLTMSIIDPSKIEVSEKSNEYYPMMYLSSVSDREIKEERDKLIPFLNPNQKFSTREEKSFFLSQYQSLEVNLAFLSQEELKILGKNTSKASLKAFDTFDKKNDFDNVIDFIYFEKKKIESENSLLHNRDYLFDSKNKKSSLSDALSISDRISNSFNNNNISDSSTDKLNASDKLEKIEEIEEKIMQASKNNTSFKKKESLIEEIKNLLKGFDSDFIINISSNLDDIIEKNKDDFSILTTTNIKISSSSEAKKYLENTEKYDIDFDDLSKEEKIIYLKNKESIVNHFISIDSMAYNVEQNNGNKNEKKTFSEINDGLSNILQKELEKEKSDIKELIGWTRVSYTVDEAVEFLKILEKRKSEISQMSEVEKSSFENSKVLANQAIRLNEKATSNFEKNILIENIDKLIYILENSKSIKESDKNTDYKKESLAFSNKNIKQQNGNFLLSQSLNVNQANVIKLVS